MAYSDNSNTDRLLSILTSMIIAFVIWFIAKQGDVETRYVEIPIELIGISEHIELSYKPATARIFVQFPQSHEKNVTKENFALRVDLDGIEKKAGVREAKDIDYSTYLNMVEKKTSEIVRIREITEPKEVIVTARWRVYEARVLPVLQGEVDSRFERKGEVTAQPAKVLITGTREQLEANRKENKGELVIRSKPIDISNIQESTEGRIALDLEQGLKLFDEEALETMSAENSTAKYTINVIEKSGTRQLKSIPVQFITLAKKTAIEASPSTATITISGPLSLLSTIRDEDIKFKTTLDEAVAFTGRAALTAVLSGDLPKETRDQVKIEEVLPSEFDITITTEEVVGPKLPPDNEF